MSIFTEVQMSRPKYSTFNLSHQRKFDMVSGLLVPCLLIETLPGDVFSSQTAQLVRAAPMVAPLMHQVTVYTHYFYVPNRIIWSEPGDGWKEFMAGGEDGLQTPLFPTIQTSLNEYAEGNLPDYMGIPTDLGSGSINAIPFGAYQMIYNEYFRDQNLIDKKLDTVLSGANNDTLEPGTSSKALLLIRVRAWQHDYFTSALPWTQKGPEVTIPLGTSAPVDGAQDGTSISFKTISGTQPTSAGVNAIGAGGNAQINSGNGTWMVGDQTGLVADLSTATAASITTLRNAFRLQEWEEKNARGGSRYNESILVHFGVDVGDARVNRPEFLGGGSTPLSISEVLQTSSTDATTPQGNMAGHGIAAANTSRWKYRCKEHGFIIGIMSILPKTAYQQGIHKLWKKFDKFDYFYKEFQHIGEQEITNNEIYHQNLPVDDEIFGYIPRYSEYKYMNDSVHGKFRTSLDFWHWGRKFASLPALNETFINAIPDTRVFANLVGEQWYVTVYHQISASRPMAYFGNPNI